MSNIIKTITLWEPWASLIAVGAKKHETRSWPTNYLGQIAIHAAKVEKYPPTGVRAVMKEVGLDPLALAYGKIVCIADLIYCMEMDRTLIAKQSVMEAAVGDWDVGRFAWRLANIRVLETPIEARGYQGFWNWTAPDDLKFTN